MKMPGLGLFLELDNTISQRTEMEKFDDEDEVRLSKKERRILINQYTILEKLTEKSNPDDSRHYGKLMSILANGYELKYHELYDWIADPVSAETCSEIEDILVMFDALTTSYKALKDQSGIDEWKVKFVGLMEILKPFMRTMFGS
jgi:uncharacterized protein YfbU (UPF0304 family)